MSRQLKTADVPRRRRPTDFAQAGSPFLQGRDDELGLIDRQLDRIDDGGSTVVVSGEPGIGKSALLDAARRRATDLGWRVLGMTGVAAEAHLPFAGLEQALRPLMARVEHLPPRQRAALLAAFGMRDDAAPPDMFLVALATLTLLTESATRKPILLVADDVQWLDQPTYDVLSFVARRLSSDPVILLAALRDGSNRSFGHAGAVRLRLSGLDETAAGQLLDAHAPDLPPELRRRYIAEASGNPLALLELPRSERAADAGDGPWLPLTERLERAFFGRASELPDATRSLLGIAAENDATSLHEILRAGDVLLGEPTGIEMLTPAISAKLIEVDGTEIKFRHPLIRSAIHQATDLVIRQKIHAALAAIIQDQPDRRVWHRAAATVVPDDELAAEHDRMAARAQRRGSVITAISALESAARLSSTAKARRHRYLQAAELAADLGQPELVERLLREVGADGQGQVAAARIGWIREMSQPPTINDPATIPALVEFAEQARLAGAKDLALNLLWRAGQHCWWSDASGAVRAGIFEAARRLETCATDSRQIAIAAYVGPLERGNDVYTKLRELSEKRTGDPAVARMLGSTANVIGAFHLGASFLGDSSAALREQGRLSDLARVLFAQAWAEMEIGDWMGAMREAEESVRFAEETGGTLWIAAATVVKAKLAGMQGDFEQSEIYATQAERLVLSVGASFLLALLQVARGVSAIGAGRHLEAYDHLRRLFDPVDPAFNSGVQFFGLADFVEAAASCGKGRAAHAVIEDIERRTAAAPVPWVAIMLAYGKALLAEPDDAEPIFHHGLGLAKEWPFLRGRLLLAYGGWLRRQRRAADARAPLRAARDIFDALGASPWSERARAELRASGESSGRRTEPIWERLTPQELQIAQLASEGLSNKEIGARLYLSHRTVGYHLHRIFPKLGITSRAGLHNALARRSGPAD
ncbi:AAA family ATPase [Bradyrhizobium sp. BRP22]|uniref:ATP-binding protein n=1 Tax=Bradyrhizobium sp. BRP22 TaxID=2793821 RepID=UPI001CD7C13B|nr:LuxR family transcriptional regulator [Bradyrhizobium sp. BRP22]MCA1452604.1 AAA family ATPase [Bradyrhizobium sp. BRP22]